MDILIPCSFVRNALALGRKGFTDSTYCHSPRVVVTLGKDYSFVHCGEYPIVATVCMKAHKNFNVVNLAYINSNNELVFPA